VIPSRAAVNCDGYRDACNTNLKHSDPPRKVAMQTYHLFPKIREIDAVLTPDLQLRVHEVHPEVSFWIMNGRIPVQVAKKVGSRNHRPGLNLRRILLGSNGFPIAELPGNHYRQSDVGEDDLIDACACAWSARRILDGQYVSFPETPERDSRSLTMCIKA
jgi:predicted RNase H-like nuclease